MTPETPDNAPSSDPLAGLDPNELIARGLDSSPISGGMGGWTAPTQEELQHMISGYEVKGLLGRGGMGAVYKVFQPDLQRMCALKLLPLEISLDASFEERFLQEARAMARLDHPNIVRLFDFGRSSEGHLYYVMEYIEGTDLAVLIKSGGIDVAGALDVVTQVCDALQYAHDEGYVHRDIKPANVLVGTKGQVKVTDFGLAKILSRQDQGHGMTMTGQVMGTPDYMAPEQSCGGQVDQRADIYALGVMLYEMLTGGLPRGVFSLPSQKVRIDVRLDEVVLRALQQEPEQRYQQVSEIKDSLQAMTQPSGSVPPLPGATDASQTASQPTGAVPPQRKKTRATTLVAVAASAGLLVAAVMLFSNRNPQQRTGQATGSNDRTDVADIAHDRAGALSPGALSPVPKPGEKYTNSLGMPFVPVAGANVLCGVWETRKKDWSAFANATKRKVAKTPDGEENYPASGISWNDANAFCVWLTEKERAAGNIGPEMEYRLPTDLEWSAAVGLAHEQGNDAHSRHLKDKSAYPWSTSWPPPPQVLAETDSRFELAGCVALHIKEGMELLKHPLDSAKPEEFNEYSKRFWHKLVKFGGDRRFYRFWKLNRWTEYVCQASSIKNAPRQVLAGKTWVNLPLPWEGDHHVQVFLQHSAWPCADWSDPELINLVNNGKLEVTKNVSYWTGATWDSKQWTLHGKPFPYTSYNADPDALTTEKFGKAALRAVLTPEGMTLVKAHNNSDPRLLLAFPGNPGNKEFSSLAHSTYDKIRAEWFRAAIAQTSTVSTPADWQRKLKPVDTLWVNSAGIKGLAGSTMEWVQDSWDNGHKVLRGSAVRMSIIRGVPFSTLPRSATPEEKTGILVAPVVPTPQALLSSYRHNANADAREGWIGFRPVLAFSPSNK